ncbi:hypothetical protein GCM10011381_20060 [Klenkia taihuensis]|nr:hypothetical protein GCM10011381_20060 [Klenkia taihuensis]
MTAHPAGMGSGTQAGTRASTQTADSVSWDSTTLWCSGVTAACRWHHASSDPGRTTRSSPQRGQTGPVLVPLVIPPTVAGDPAPCQR